MGEESRPGGGAPAPRRRRRRDRWTPLLEGLKKAWFLGWLALAVSLTWGVLRFLDFLSA
ncbi:MAG: hypothetical protein L6R43_00730 [Planctomycetes bacterium]|nr:hypothetical protein [Planctomycetota bacterium]